ncbi:hypothetical protein ACL02T_15960 [Pseudonocardia sp. RS010]|uniref:hypothetical protein n=1 Tax=Pseudonocardia sp. RS010 TaxID=3385979 RepID=UPI00399F5F24
MMLVVAAGAYMLLMTWASGPGGVLVLAVVVGLSTFGVYGPIVTYLTEQFPSTIRASGYAVDYSLAVVVPSFYPFYLNGLGHHMPARLTSVVPVARVAYW